MHSRFIRHRNVLIASGDFSQIFADYRAHMERFKFELPPHTDEVFFPAFAAFLLHCTAHPQNENISWTLNFQRPLLNVFFAGDTGDGTVVGRIFTDNVKVSDHNEFHQDLIPYRKNSLRSYTEFTGHDALLAAEQFYDRSEQRPARFFQLDESRFTVLSAHPDWDEAWFNDVTLDEVRHLDEQEVIVPLERRFFRYECGCNEHKILNVLAPHMKEDPESLFGNDDSLQVKCPRCCATYRITKETLEAHLAALESKQENAGNDA